MTDKLDELPIGRRIEAVRKHTGKTRKVIADLVGMSENWMRDIETSARRTPSIEMIVQLARGSLGRMGSSLDKVVSAQHCRMGRELRAGIFANSDFA